MNRITNEQREAIVRRAIAERDALLRATPLVTHCPWCSAPVSVADEPYCANDDCRWNNGGTAHPRCRIAGEAMNPNERTSTNPDGVEVRPSAISELRERIAAERNAGVEPCDGGKQR